MAVPGVRSVVFVTGNAKKLEEVRNSLDYLHVIRSADMKLNASVVSIHLN